MGIMEKKMEATIWPVQGTRLRQGGAKRFVEAWMLVFA